PRAEAPRVFALLDELRRGLRVEACADVGSGNAFSAASRPASSASGFAALALAGVRASGSSWSAERVADLARRGSARAARRLSGRLRELEGTEVRPVAPADHLPLVVLVCVTTEGPKAIGSS